MKVEIEVEEMKGKGEMNDGGKKGERENESRLKNF